MKKTILSSLILAVILLAVALQGCEKEPIDETLDGKTVNYTVLVVSAENAAKSINGLDGASVTVSINGKDTTVTTGSAGHANFSNIASGVIAVTVEKENYTTLNYLVDLTPAQSSDAYDATLERNSSTLVAVYPTKSATISGFAWATLDETLPVTTDQFAPAGTNVYAQITNDLTLYNAHTGDGLIQNQFYENIITTSNVGTDGTFSFQVPAGRDGVSISIYGDNFQSDYRDAGSTVWADIPFSSTTVNTTCFPGQSYYRMDIVY